MGAVNARLPWPPSVNHYYTHTRKGVFISPKGRLFRKRVIALLGQQVPLEGELRFCADFFPPDKRKRDLDNIGGKALLDALQHANAYKDDSQIKEIHLRMLSPVKDGLCIVHMEELGTN